jgi:hypothetical protein
MSDEISPRSDAGREVPPEGAEGRDVTAPAEVPAYVDVLPDTGKEVVVIGDPEGRRELNHHQGDNPLGFQGTCGLVSCEDLLRWFGKEVTEADVVLYAAIRGLCYVGDDPTKCGGTSEWSQAQLLSELGVPAHVESGRGLDDLAGWVQEGRGIIIEVNAGELWNFPGAYDEGQANHAIVVTGVARDPDTGAVEGFYINDSGRGYPGDSGRFIPAELMERAWVEPGGSAVVTDVVRGE